MASHYIVPTFNKSETDKVHNKLAIIGQNTVSHPTASGDWFSAIAAESIPATVDGEYIFALRIDNIGDAFIMIGVTPMATIDSNRESYPDGSRMTGSALWLHTGNYYPGNKPNLIDAKISKKAEEVIVVVTISPGRLYGHNCSIRWIVDGNSSPNQDCTAHCNGNKLFPVVSVRVQNSQITTIPIDQVTIRNDEVNKLIAKCAKQSSSNQGAVANNNQQEAPSAAFAQLQQELEKERKRGDLAEKVLRQEKQNSAVKDQQLQQKDQELHDERTKQAEMKLQQQLDAEKKNSTFLATQLNQEKQNSSSLIQQKDQLIAQLQQENKNLLQEISALKKDSDLGATMSLPAPRCFDMALSSLPDVKESLRQLLSLREVPPGRPDLQGHIPTDKNVTNILNVLDIQVSSLKQRDAVKQLIASCGLTDDNIRALFLYGAEHPYSVYRWLNGWLTGSRRDDKVKQAVGPFFNHLYRAMEKLPKIKSRGARAVKVNNIASLVATYDNYVTRLAAGQHLSFWGVSSFSTNDAVINDPMFCGQPYEEGIIYMCGELVGVDMEPFKPDGMPSEDEILPMCPAVFEVQAAVKNGAKLIVSLKQTGHDIFSYVEPSAK